MLKEAHSQPQGNCRAVLWLHPAALTTYSGVWVLPVSPVRTPLGSQGWIFWPDLGRTSPVAFLCPSQPAGAERGLRGLMPPMGTELGMGTPRCASGSLPGKHGVKSHGDGGPEQRDSQHGLDGVLGYPQPGEPLFGAGSTHPALQLAPGRSGGGGRAATRWG